ncbi:hypothetical protein [Candidatus Poriferisodalis sp.]|uniref:hypothetical protein n=1 Tax=Candidatus Poriferisodalis sp. TaxID=3101277 RepID=UPI003C704DF7
MLEPTLHAVEVTGMHHDIGSLSSGRGYGYLKVRARLAESGLADLDMQRRGTKPSPGAFRRLSLGLRGIVEATNT